MTLVIALKWFMGDGEAILMASDSRVSIEYLTYETRKIYPVILIDEKGEQVPLAVMGGAGDSSLVKQSFRMCEKILRGYVKEEWGFRTPSFDEFEESVGDIESALISRFRSLRSMGIDPSFSMVLGSVDPSGKASLYLFDSRVLAEPVHDNPGFAVIGRGFFTGGNLLLKLLDYRPEASTEMNLGVLTAFIIDLVSEVDASVGSFVGESWLMRVSEGKVLLGPLREEAYKKFKEKVRVRRELFKDIWRACDKLGEDRVYKAVKKLLTDGNKKKNS